MWCSGQCSYFVCGQIRLWDVLLLSWFIMTTRRPCSMLMLWHCPCSPGKHRASASNPRASWWNQASSQMSGLLFSSWSLASYLTFLKFSFYICGNVGSAYPGLQWRLNEEMRGKDFTQWHIAGVWHFYNNKNLEITQVMSNTGQVK